eukprot:11492364-Alexandrium_andersonii.AAC.1
MCIRDRPRTAAAMLPPPSRPPCSWRTGPCPTSRPPARARSCSRTSARIMTRSTGRLGTATSAPWS